MTVPGGLAATRSLSAIIRDLLIMAASLLLPLAAVVALPVGGGFAVLGLGVMAEWIIIRRGWKHTHISHVVSGLALGLACNLILHLPWLWGWMVATLVLFIGLAIQGTLENPVKRAPKESNPATSIVLSKPGFAQLTPQDEPVQVIAGEDGGYEHRMGYVYAYDYLLPDNILLRGWGVSTAFSSDGRYFAADRDGDGIDLLDRQTRKTYRYDCPHTHHVRTISDGIVRVSSRYASSRDLLIPIAEVLAHGKAQDLVADGDYRVQAS